MFLSYNQGEKHELYQKHQLNGILTLENQVYNGFDFYADTRSISNVTMGYNTYIGSFEYKKNEILFKKPLKFEQKKQDVMGVAYVSNCDDRSHRMGFITALQHHGVTIDIFGKCGGWKKEPPSSYEHDRYLRKIENMSKYKFSLSLENSKTNDYVTEKYWQAIIAGSVPISNVPNIKNYAPSENSVLAVSDFKNLKDLANRIIYLSKNEVEYENMMAWKYNENPSDQFLALMDYTTVEPFCQICLRISDQYQYNLNNNLIYIRERNTFRYKIIARKFESLKELTDIILELFADYQPSWMKFRKRLNGKKMRIYRIFKSGSSFHESLFGINYYSQENYWRITKGWKLEVIFL